MPTAYGYTRVSTTDQELSPEGQSDQIKAYYDLYFKDTHELGGILHDHGVSAFKVPWQERPAGRELLHKLTRGDVLIVTTLDRIWRSSEDRIKTCRFLEEAGIGLVIISLKLDTTTAMGRFVVGVLGEIAQYESAVRGERMVNAHRVRRKRKTPFRAQPPAGWHFSVKKGRLVPDLVERKLLDQIYWWNEAGVQSIKTTAAWLKENGITRRSGHQYDHTWLYRHRPYWEAGWPCEGYTKDWWRSKGDEWRENRRARLAKLKAKTKKAHQATWDLRMMRAENLKALLTGEIEDTDTQPVDLSDAPPLASTQPASQACS